MVTRELGRGICSARERGTAVPSEKTRRTRSGCVRATVARTRSAQRVAIAPVCKAQDARQVCKQSIIHAPVAVRARACASWSPSALWGTPRARVWNVCGLCSAAHVQHEQAAVRARLLVSGRAAWCASRVHQRAARALRKQRTRRRAATRSAAAATHRATAAADAPPRAVRRERAERLLAAAARRPVSSAAAVTIAPGDSCALGRRDAGGDNEATSATATACKRALKPSRCTSGDALP